MNLDDFLEQTGECEWLVDGLIPARAKILVAAPPGHGKSWTLEDLAVSVEVGLPFLDRYAVTQPGPVALVDQDTPSDVLADRMRALTRERPCPYLHVLSQENFALDTASGVQKLITKLRPENPALIVLETLETLTSGDFDENKAKDVDKLFKNLDRVQREFDCSIVLSHHLGKKRQGGDAGSRIRGSSALLARVDVAYTLQRLSGSEDSRRFLVQPVPKRFSTAPGFQFELETGQDHGRLVTAQLHWLADWSTNLDPTLADGRMMVLDLIRERRAEGLTVNDAVAVSEGYLSDRDTREILHSLQEEGVITRLKEGHGRFRFWFPEYAPDRPTTSTAPISVESNGEWQTLEG